jgi:hypothetical protein
MIARYYNADANPDGAHFPGVPLRDLTEDEYEALPKHMQHSIDASPLYRKTKPSASRKAEPKSEAAAAPVTTDAPSAVEKEA